MKMRWRTVELRSGVFTIRYQAFRRMLWVLTWSDGSGERREEYRRLKDAKERAFHMLERSTRKTQEGQWP